MTEQEAFNRLAALCAASEHCRHDVMEKMRRWQLSDDACRRVTDRLVDARYIDETRYCRAFVSDKTEYAKWGKLKIAQALRMKRIPDEMAENALSALDDETQLSVLRPLLERKEREIRDTDAWNRRQKLVRYAAGRGFEMRVICRCLDCREDVYDD